MSEPTSGNTLTLGLVPLSTQYPSVADDTFLSCLSKTEAGGDGTQAYFDAQNETSTFWTELGAGQVNFVDGLDPQGRPVVMASSGNVELRVQAVPTGSVVGPVGILTITTREQSTGIQRRMSTGVIVQENPSSLQVDAEVFMQLLPTLYESTEIMLGKLAASFAQASQVETPSVDAESLAADAMFFASKKVLGLTGSFTQWALEYSVVTWGNLALESVGVGVLVAIPTIVEFLGHRMRHSVLVQNLTDGLVGWQEWVTHGDSVISQPVVPIAGTTSGPDPLQPSARLTLSTGLNLQYLNDTDWGSIGYVLSLTMPDDTEARVLFNIPWAGDNVLWVGASNDTPSTVWDEQHSGSDDPPLSMSAEVGGYRVLASLNRLSGQTYGAYFYCSTVVIQPK